MLTDNPELFYNQFAFNDGVNNWYFTIYRDDPNDPQKQNYGISDESGKVGLNQYQRDEEGNWILNPKLREVLARMELLDDEQIDCLMDYLDPDDEPRSQGAEAEYYDQLAYPYRIKNGPLSTSEEILMVKGFSGFEMYGNDANLNQMLDANENDGNKRFPDDAEDGVLNRGLFGRIAAMTYGPNLDREGNRRIRMDQAEAVSGNSEKLTNAGLAPETIHFILLCAQDGKRFAHPAELYGAEYQLTADQTLPDGGTFPAGTTVRANLQAEQLPIVCDFLTTRGDFEVGLVNLNSASKEVLKAVGFDEGQASQLISRRQELLGDEKLGTISWPVTENIIDAETFKAIAPLLTVRGYQYRVLVVGYGVPCGRFRVLEALVDVSGSDAKIIYLRDLTRLGLPTAMDAELQETVR